MEFQTAEHIANASLLTTKRQKIMRRFSLEITDRKKLPYCVNAVLGARKVSNLQRGQYFNSSKRAFAA
jgi:hypothetical protein